MILFPNTRNLQSEERAVTIGSTVTAEGQALINDTTGGVGSVKPSGGNSGEQFVGLSLSQQLTLLYVPAVESLVSNASDQITLAHTPAGGTLRVVDATTGTDQAAGNPATTLNEYSISGNVITLHADLTGHTFLVYYRYSPSTVEARTLQGDIPAGGAAGQTLGTVGVITQGTVYTSEYDSSKNWGAANVVIKTGAGGLLTIGGNGDTVRGVVVEPPSVDNAFLGIRFTV